MDLRKRKLKGTLVFPVRRGSVLLGRKTKQIGAGLWNGWGGSIEKGETERKAAARELAKESGLIASPYHLSYCGKVIFHNQRGRRKFDVEVHMFLSLKWIGNIYPSDGMEKPTWWPIKALPPWQEFMPSDKDWLPYVLAERIIVGETWQEWVPQEDGSEKVVLTKASKIVPIL